jgi:hypothetical protein
MPTNAELIAENNELLDENERLQAELDEARRNQMATPNTKPVTEAPSFGMSEGERNDLLLTGTSVSPFTGKVTTEKK